MIRWIVHLKDGTSFSNDTPGRKFDDVSPEDISSIETFFDGTVLSVGSCEIFKNMYPVTAAFIDKPMFAGGKITSGTIDRRIGFFIDTTSGRYKIEVILRSGGRVVHLEGKKVV